MKYTIKKGKHYANPRRFRIYNRTQFEWTIKFNESVKYTLPDGYQLDIQKLIGVGFFGTDDSARFGFRYNPKFKYMVEIMAYTHDNGKVTKDGDEKHICFVPIDSYFKAYLHFEKGHYVFHCNNVTVKLPKSHDKKWGYCKGFYFEWNGNGATQDISVIIK